MFINHHNSYKGNQVNNLSECFSGWTSNHSCNFQTLNFKGWFTNICICYNQLIKGDMNYTIIQFIIFKLQKQIWVLINLFTVWRAPFLGRKELQSLLYLKLGKEHTKQSYQELLKTRGKLKPSLYPSEYIGIYIS